ncbi:DNA-formamidopyrimidine glycosylase [Candidatus Xianfuyuplasma coldseepsis]|uniref:Formamidopyrimidine-DNA glycosylase n=1 Tax=Candidatus Xianfuyuplasma coldseepsis TaxID=2782163 RepID=A0A7L7KS52_9MOLU|nr:DNA-formamidopyrimidine glycosylase [Xianfuyuplasma coldseepsis]QMS85547.1 DNA-formamidopyrimidine glycosylase [Xianfuyuplasma coldseepsis]
MPEMPEVETVRRILQEVIVGKTIRDIDVFYPKMIRNVDEATFIHMLEGQTIKRMDRYGKHLQFITEDWVVFSHLRMEGKYFIKPLDEPKEKHEHMIIYFTDGTSLRYHDTRKFGTFDVIHPAEIKQNSPLVGLGPEPTSSELTPTYLTKKLRHKTRAIKPTLLDQTVICGLGNIYVDEVLFRSKIHPETPAGLLTKKQIKFIIQSCKQVIEKAIELGGTTVRSYTASLGVTGRFQNELNVHTKVDQPCPVCGTTISKTKVGGRGTYLCTTCQKQRHK